MAIRIAGVQLGNIGGGPSSLTLEDLADVSIVPTKQTGQYLRYNGTINEWQNAFINADVYSYLNTNLTSSNGVVLTKLSGPETIDIGLSLSAAGDASGSTTSGILNLTLTSVNSSVGTYGSSSIVPQITVNAKGQITSVTPISISNTSALAHDLVGGATGSLPYQSAPNTTVFLPAGTTSQVLVGSPSAPSWSNTPTLTGTNFSGIPNAALTNSSVTIGSTSISLGGSSTTLGGLTGVTLVSGTITGNLTGNVTGTASGNLPLIGGTMSGAIAMGGYSITGLPTTQSSDPSSAASKLYVDNIAAGVNVHAACETATTTALPTVTYYNGVANDGVGATLTATANGNMNTIHAGGTGYYTADGLQNGDRLLVKNQATTLQNGIYIVTDVGADDSPGPGAPFILTRSTDYDGSPTSEVVAGDLTYVQEGTLAGTQWVETNIGTGHASGPPAYDYVIVGTDPIIFSQFSGAGTYTAGSGISIGSNIISNTGVLSLTTNTGLSSNVSATGNVTVTNTGVTSNVAGTGITVSSATGAVTIGTANIPNSSLTNSSITVGTTPISLGASSTTLAGLTSVTSSAITASGSLTMGNGAFFTGDFTNFANRPMFQTNVTNGITVVEVIPNGTGTRSGMTFDNASGQTNDAYLFVGVNTAATAFTVDTLTRGSGTALPLKLAANDIVGISIDTTGDVSIPTTLAVTGTVTAPTFSGNLSGNATTATSATSATSATTSTNISSGTSNSIPYQSAPGTTSFLAQGTGVLQETAGAPIWTTTPTLTGTNFSSIPNGALTNSSITIGSTTISLGNTSTILAGLSSVTATTFTGALSGNATTATSATSATTATTATNVTGGAAGSLVYQTGSGTTTTLALGTSGYVLTAGGSAPQWTVASSVTTGTATNLAGGATNQIPFQSAPSTTTFSSAFTFTAGSSLLNVGSASTSGILAGIDGSTSTTGLLTVRSGLPATGSPGGLLLSGGDVSSGSTAGSVTINGGNNVVSGNAGNVSIQGGNQTGGTGTGTAGTVSITGGTHTAFGSVALNGGAVTLSGGLGGNGTSVGGAVNINGGLVGAGTGGAIIFSTGNTSLTERFRITAAGEWQLAGSGGTSGQVLTSAGSGTPPVWANAGAATNIAGGLANEIPFQSAPSTTTFSTGFTFNSGTSTLSVGSGIAGAISSSTGQSLSISSDVSITFATNGTNVLVLNTNGSLTVSGIISINGIGATYSATLTTSTTSAGQIVDQSLAVASYRSVKYQISVTSGSAYEYTEVVIMHDGTNTYITENNTLLSGSSLATFTAGISGGNLQLLTTPANAVTTYKVVAVAIAV